MSEAVITVRDNGSPAGHWSRRPRRRRGQPLWDQGAVLPLPLRHVQEQAVLRRLPQARLWKRPARPV